MSEKIYTDYQKRQWKNLEHQREEIQKEIDKLREWMILNNAPNELLEIFDKYCVQPRGEMIWM